MAKQGRKTLLNKEIAEAIVNALKLGNYMTTAADYVGVTPLTIANWLRKGEALSQVDDRELDNDEQMFVDFFMDCKKAKALSEMKAVNVIREASQSSWQAAAWYLERTANDRWGRIQRTEITGADGGAIEINADAVARKLEALLDKNVLDTSEAISVGQDELVAKTLGALAMASSDDTGDTNSETSDDNGSPIA